MPHQHDIPLRDARDRVIDLLGFGETYPLRDLPVLDERLTVPFRAKAKLPIALSQKDVRYKLFDREGQPVKQIASEKTIEAQGTGDTLLLESPPIEEDTTYQIQGLKTSSGLNTFLWARATVKVGLDLSLKAEIQTGARLHPGLDALSLDDARIVDYGVKVEVALQNSQEGVDYTLVDLKPDGSEVSLSETSVRGKGDGAAILLSSRALLEDVDLRIRATKTFGAEEERATQSALLETLLPLKVRANRALSLAFAPSVIPFKGETSFKIEGTQRSVSYQLFIKKIPDADFIHGDAGGASHLNVPIEGAAPVQLRAPSTETLWKTPAGFVEIGSPKSGTGGLLQFALKGLTEDSFILVQAEKSHQVLPEAIPSIVSLAQATALLVRPDPAPALSLRVDVTKPAAIDSIMLSGGQLGVFYYLRPTPESPDLARPAYFHQKDPQDASQNKGLGELKIGVDFVVPRDFPQKPLQAPAKSFPLDPLLAIENASLGSTLSILAVKAQSGLGQVLLKGAALPSLPEIAFEHASVPSGSAARLLITASQPGERYTLTLGGDKVKTARNGNGSDRTMTTNILIEAAVFELLVTRPQDSGLPVTRVLTLQVGIL